jgi:hypothetical protein
MTTLCRIVLTVVTCTADPAAPKPTPAEAVAILNGGGRQFYVAEAVPPWEGNGGGGRYPMPYDGDWPFTGTFAPTWMPTGQRLDGTSLLDPPAFYGAPPFGYSGNVIVPGYSYGSPFVRRSHGNHREHAPGREPQAGRAPGAPDRPARSPAPAPRGQTSAPAGVGGARVR